MTQDSFSPNTHAQSSQSADMMAPQEPPTVIEIKNTLKEKVGGSLSARNIQAATLAVKNLADEFSEVLSDTLTELLKQRENATNETFRQPVKVNASSLFKHALDLKSSGTLCGFPLVTRVAHSLCRLLVIEGRDIPPSLVDAHIDTLRAILREDIKDPSHPVASVLAQELEKQVFSLK